MGRFITSIRPLHRWVCAGMLLTIGSAGLLLWAADLTQPKPNDRYVTRVVDELMRRDHLLQKPLDDEIAQRALTLYLKALDPMKFYFYQVDIDEFQTRVSNLDNEFKRGDISFAYSVFKRFLARVDERLEMVEQILSQPLDFTADEQMITDPDQVRFARTVREATERWQRRLKYQLLVLKAEKEEGEAGIAKLRRRYASFARRMKQTDSDELLEMYLTSFTSSFDPHTSYMSPTSLDDFQILMRLNLEGIGAGLKSEEDGYVVVTKILPNGAADKQGKLKPEDKIVSVGQAEGEMVDVVDMKLRDVVKLIRGSAGTTVRLGVVPAAGGELEVYTLTRSRVELSDNEAKGAVFQHGLKRDGTPYRIGVIDLPSFYMDMEAARLGLDPNFKSTTRDVRRILEDFQRQQVEAVVLDLRRNGGGSLTEAIDLTGLFVDRGPVVQVKDANNRVQPYHDDVAGMSWRGPLVVVTSRFSASASEILAGAIQDYRRGLIIGDQQTHGKGTVQSLLELGEQLFPRIENPPNLGALKVTMQQFYRPNGESTQQRGVVSDVKLPALSDYLRDINESDLDYAIAWDKIPAARYSDFKMTNPPLLTELKARSAARVAKSEKFAKEIEDINRYVDQKKTHSIPLNEEKFFARRAELNIDDEEKKQFENQERSSDEVIKRDYYMDEVLNVTMDYIQLLGTHLVASAN